MAGFPEIAGLAATSLIVVAPHPDDDVLGCGALIARVAPHLPVRVIYVTDGAASHDGSPTYPPQRLRDVREREARRGLRRLGVKTPPLFLGWPDARTWPWPCRGGAIRTATIGRCIRSSMPCCTTVRGQRDSNMPCGSV